MANDARVKITLACTECKQRNYDTKKNKKNDPDRLELMKYCNSAASIRLTRKPSDRCVTGIYKIEERNQVLIMKKGTMKKWLTLLCAMMLTFSLFAIPAFAEDGTADTNKLSVPTIVGLCILGALVIAAAVLCIIFREKVKKFLRVYKSESKKIVWLPWDQTKKSTWVVLIVLAISAVVICLLDLGLSRGLNAFISWVASKL